MKNYIYNKLPLIALLLTFSFSITSCNEDETLVREGKPTLSLAAKSTTATEGENVSMDFELSFPIGSISQVRVEVVGGTAVEGEDYSFNLGTVDDQGGGFFGGDGYYAEMPAYLTSYTLSDFITIAENNQAESAETIQLRLFSVSKAEALVDDTFTITINPHNERCAWSLSMSDSYGDGWNGGFISLDVNGNISNYSNQDLDGVQGYTLETQVIDVFIEDGAQYTFTYNAGAGNGGGPGYDSENTYILTAPDGTTMFADGPTPIDGDITSGTNTCN
ncbi:hypothetical protein [uncultured Lacinutrix sp.]|uniref:hypothetical protein n=1 Tax=uncultured Lacinutrix sp. TaxID=574032 RepID=UPI00262CDAA0|nr:hypothetical protein [uncultured Lacinutrix sp.]